MRSADRVTDGCLMGLSARGGGADFGEARLVLRQGNEPHHGTQLVQAIGLLAGEWLPAEAAHTAPLGAEALGAIGVDGDPVVQVREVLGCTLALFGEYAQEVEHLELEPGATVRVLHDQPGVVVRLGTEGADREPALTDEELLQLVRIRSSQLGPARTEQLGVLRGAAPVPPRGTREVDRTRDAAIDGRQESQPVGGPLRVRGTAGVFRARRLPRRELALDAHEVRFELDQLLGEGRERSVLGLHGRRAAAA